MSPKQEQEAHERNAIVPRSMQSDKATQSDSVERRNWIAEMVAATAEVMGTELSAPARAHTAVAKPRSIDSGQYRKLKKY